MKIFVFSTSGDMSSHLEKLGVLGSLSEYKIYNFRDTYEIEVDSIQELYNLSELFQHDLIIRVPSDFDGRFVVEIYDKITLY